MNAVARGYSIRPENEFGLLGDIIGQWVGASRARSRNRRAAQYLRGMSENQLKDIGLSRGEITYAVRFGRRARG